MGTINIRKNVRILGRFKVWVSRPTGSEGFDWTGNLTTFSAGIAFLKVKKSLKEKVPSEYIILPFS